MHEIRALNQICGTGGHHGDHDDTEAHPDLTVAEIHRLKRIGKAVDGFLDKIGN